MASPPPLLDAWREASEGNLRISTSKRATPHDFLLPSRCCCHSIVLHHALSLFARDLLLCRSAGGSSALPSVSASFSKSGRRHLPIATLPPVNNYRIRDRHLHNLASYLLGLFPRIVIHRTFLPHTPDSDVPASPIASPSPTRQVRRAPYPKIFSLQTFDILSSDWTSFYCLPDPKHCRYTTIEIPVLARH